MAAAGEKRGTGRPTKLTSGVQEKIIQAIRAGNYASVAAEYAGIGERTFYRWMEQGEAEEAGPYRQFWQAVKEAEAHAEVRAVAIIQKHMEDNWVAAMTYIERKFPERWSRKDRHEHTGAEGGPIEFRNVESARAEVEGRLAGLAAAGDADEVSGQPEPAGDGEPAV